MQRPADNRSMRCNVVVPEDSELSRRRLKGLQQLGGLFIGRMAQPEEVASLALFLCSSEASFITGVDYPLDGGFVNLRG